MIKRNLIGYWKLSSDLSDSTGLNADLVKSDSSVNLSFEDGVKITDYCCLKTPTDILTQYNVTKYTIAMQVKGVYCKNYYSGLMVLGSGGSYIGGIANGIITQFNSDNFIILNGRSNDDNVSIPNPFTDPNKWYDIIYMFDGVNTEFYVDGVKLATTQYNNRKETQIGIGGFPRLGAGNQSMQYGIVQTNVKNLMIYSDSLTSDEIPKAFEFQSFLINDIDTNEIFTFENGEKKIITQELTKEVFDNNGIIGAEEINKNINLLPERFKIITNKNKFSIRGIKSLSELVVANNVFYTKIAEHIDYFKCLYEKNANSSIKLAFSIDNGITWKGNNFEELSVEIPLKEYSELTEEELVQWNNAKDTIYTNGIPIEDLESIDFNTLDFEYIRFAYVLSVTNATDTCNTSKLQWQFDTKGSMQLMDSSEVTVEILSDTIKVTPKVETELMKVNITNGTIDGGIEEGTSEDIDNFLSNLIGSR